MNKPKNNPYVSNTSIEFENIDEIDRTKAKAQVEELIEAIEYHDYRYYVKNDPVISDQFYDKLFHRLQDLENEFDLHSPISPTQRVGGQPLDELPTLQHEVEMLSLDSSAEELEVRDFDKRVKEKVNDPTYYIEPKFDGLSAEFVYRDGELDVAVTRGDGVEGDDITENIKTIKTVPLRINNGPELLVIRGEIYMPKDGFQKLNKKMIEQGNDPFANPRNAAAGTVRRLEPSIVANRPLDVFFYDIMTSTKSFDYHQDAVNYLKNLGFKVSDLNQIVSSIDEFIDYRNSMMDQRESFNFEIDGVICKLDSLTKREVLGSTASHPRWAFAYKFPAKTEITMVRDIIVQVGRTGKLTPVALLDPVDIGGVTISRASLHNDKQVQKLGVSAGARVRIERAGDVIPQVKEVIEKGEDEFNMPRQCPICSSKVIGEEEHHFCSGGISCPAQLKGSLEHFSSQDSMDIDGLGEKVAHQLVEQGLVEQLPDLYNLTAEDLIGLDKFAEKSANNLLEAIENSKNVDFASFINALGIRHVGKETARDIAMEFTIDELKNINEEQLLAIEDIGPKVAENIISFFHGQGGNLVDKLLDVGVKPQRESTENLFEGVKLVFTGSLENYSRREITELMQKYGANVTSSVSSVTDYLIAGDNPGSTKMNDAKNHGVTILNEKEFEETFLNDLE